MLRSGLFAGIWWPARARTYRNRGSLPKSDPCSSWLQDDRAQPYPVAVLVALLDTNVFDRLVADDEGRQAVLAAVEHQRLRLRTTHVQEDELANITDADKRAAIEAIPRDVVPTSVMVLGVSKWGEARLGGTDEYAAIRSESGNHVQDAIIAATAASDAHVLVTEDRRLAKRSGERLRVTVWDANQLVAWAKEHRSTATDLSTGDSLGATGRVLEEAEWLGLEQRVDAHGQALKDIIEALRALHRELKQAKVLSQPREYRY